MADKTAPQNAPATTGTPTGFYLLVGVMGLAFVLIVGYMIYLYFS
jgi:hypothetical protein